jgi:Ca2+-binding EF-hand superfamily protein
MEQFNRFFAEFDINNDGVIQKSEMARFIKRFIYGEQNYPLGDSSSLI